jgi:peptide-methionine (S)-S-oxide reductase
MNMKQSAMAEVGVWTPDIPPLDRMIPGGLKTAAFAMG